MTILNGQFHSGDDAPGVVTAYAIGNGVLDRFSNFITAAISYHYLSIPIITISFCDQKYRNRSIALEPRKIHRSSCIASGGLERVVW